MALLLPAAPKVLDFDGASTHPVNCPLLLLLELFQVQFLEQCGEISEISEQ